eukprot:SAG31_NODE_4888_length_2884_cov_1.624776_4_plen_140_part_00
MSPLKIFHVPGTRSVRPIWLCKELDLPFDPIVIPFDKSFRFSEEWLKINPVGKVPAMQDGELTMFESGAMVQYLVDKYGAGRLQPETGTLRHAEYLQWAWFAEATMARVRDLLPGRASFHATIPHQERIIPLTRGNISI